MQCNPNRPLKRTAINIIAFWLTATESRLPRDMFIRINTAGDGLINLEEFVAALPDDFDKNDAEDLFNQLDQVNFQRSD